jgi:hypothetical protein
MPRWLSATIYRLLLALSDKSVHRGIIISISEIDDGERSALVPRICAALDLIARYDPRRFVRIVRDVPVVRIGIHPEYPAVWLQPAQACELSRSFLRSPTATPAAIASAIVHEALHARLHRCGIRYDESTRVRVEQLCFEAQRCFASRLPPPEGPALVAQAERQMARDDQYWTDAAFAARRLHHFVAIGVPRWLAKLLNRLAQRGAA